MNDLETLELVLRRAADDPRIDDRRDAYLLRVVAAVAAEIARERLKTKQE
jgi:hypothetical protein